MAEQAGRRNGLRKNDADGNKNGAAARGERNSDFRATSFGVLIAAAESDATFRKVFADCDFFLKTTAADAGENTSFYARAVAAGEHAFVFVEANCWSRWFAEIGLRLDPRRDGR